MRNAFIPLVLTFFVCIGCSAAHNDDKKVRYIRERVRHINSIGQWVKVDTVELEGPAEGGEAIFYSMENGIARIVVRYYGEMFRQTSEYYVLNGDLLFVYSCNLDYNRPIYWDSLQAGKNGDSESFDNAKSESFESRTYFYGGKPFLHKTSGSPPKNGSSDATAEEVLAAYNELLRLNHIR